MLVLAGDIGGTKVGLGLFRDGVATNRQLFASARYQDLESICTKFLAKKDAALDAAAFGIAGPIVEGRTEATNLPWVIEQNRLARLLGCPVVLINDLESTAHGIAELKGGEILTLNEGQEVHGGARAIIAAGTGLGEGYMVYDASRALYRPQASEGGHADLGARNPDEIALLKFLIDRFGHVSAERVVSGMGIKNVFDHLDATGRYDVPAPLREALASGDPAPVISRAAMAGIPAICVETMRLFVAAYGAEAGNLALKTMALGGVYIGGGIAPKILPLMREGVFLRCFLDKGRFAPLLGRMPLRIILNQQTALLGAAAVARRCAGGDGSHRGAPV